jgi:hypothetical protein
MGTETEDAASVKTEKSRWGGPRMSRRTAAKMGVLCVGLIHGTQDVGFARA